MTPSERARERLRDVLDRDAWTQREFAGKVGKSQPWLVKILSGENALRLDDLDAVAFALKMPAAELIRDPENELLELTPSEMRAIRALRHLPEVLLMPVLLILDALTEKLSMSEKDWHRFQVGSSTKSARRSNGRRPRSVSATAADEAERLRAYLTALSVDIAAAATAVSSPEPLADPRARPPKHRGVRD